MSREESTGELVATCANLCWPIKALFLKTVRLIILSRVVKSREMCTGIFQIYILKTAECRLSFESSWLIKETPSFLMPTQESVPGVWMKFRLDSIDILSYATLSMTDEVLELENTQLLLLADRPTIFFIHLIHQTLEQKRIRLIVTAMIECIGTLAFVIFLGTGCLNWFHISTFLSHGPGVRWWVAR